MHYTYRNVNNAFQGIVKSLLSGTINVVEERSRLGDVYRILGPVTLTYTHPTERVLFNTVRDCNPFFNLYQSLWMLAGGKDLSKLVPYCENEGVDHLVAYGGYWRDPYTQLWIDQLSFIVAQLKDQPTTRRAVLSMWDREQLPKANDPTDEVPCDLNVIFDVQLADPEEESTDNQARLNMTVFNRSSDLIEGMLGVNAVHFSFLQEYMAARVGVEVGAYHQVSANCHVHIATWLGEEYLNETITMHSPNYATITPLRLVEDVVTFDRECAELVENPEALCKEPFLAEVAQPMLLAWRHHRERDYTKAYEAIDRVASTDWKSVARSWIRKREKNYEQQRLADV